MNTNICKCHGWKYNEYLTCNKCLDEKWYTEFPVEKGLSNCHVTDEGKVLFCTKLRNAECHECQNKYKKMRNDIAFIDKYEGPNYNLGKVARLRLCYSIHSFDKFKRLFGLKCALEHYNLTKNHGFIKTN